MKVVISPGWSRPLIVSVASVLCFASAAAAQDPLAKAKTLYDSASYEEALTLLDPIDAIEAQQYKALCQLALGRAQDAANTVERLLINQPTFVPSALDVPPRFVTLVNDTKRKLLPPLARRTFAEGRDMFKNGSREESMRRFNLVMTLTSDPAFTQTPEAEDLRTLASGFIELVKASEPPPAPVAPQVARAAEPARPAPPLEVIQSVAVKQFIPPVPPEVGTQGSPVLSVRVVIGPNGRVTDASVQQAAHPLYDRLVLRAARDWIYEPATMNGKPVTSEKVVTINLR